ncbi:orc1/cdc6 family replication initiation protein [Candidatus Woesearchaeota archaeon]|nr:orc1/cdc6 family replication initiation protein [Candidatus Woesearchaeota archaeon]
MAWYDDYDFSDDPFAVSERVYGLDKVFDELVYRVESGSMAYIEGKDGSGKTALVRKLIGEFGGKGKVILFDCGQIGRKVNIEGLMKGKYGLFGRVFGAVPRDMMLFLDNANQLSKKNCERIKYYFDSNYIKSVVFTGTSYARAKFSKSVRDRIGDRVIRLKPLTPEQAVELVNERAPGLKLLSEDAIKKIYKRSGSNVRMFLTGLSAACASAVNEGSGQVSDEQIKKAFGDTDGQ